MNQTGKFIDLIILWIHQLINFNTYRFGTFKPQILRIFTRKYPKFRYFHGGSSAMEQEPELGPEQAKN